MKFINKTIVFEIIDTQTEIIDSLLDEINDLTMNHVFLMNHLNSLNLGRIISIKFIFLLQYLRNNYIDEEIRELIYYWVIFCLNEGVNELYNIIKCLRFILDENGKLKILNIHLLSYYTQYNSSVNKYYNLIYEINIFDIDYLISNYDKNYVLNELEKQLRLRK